MGASLADAVRAIAAGELVVYPTDTLIGIGARATDEAAVDRLAAAKDRPPSLPVSVAVSSPEEIEPFARVSPEARRFLRRHLPGPYTVLLEPSSLGRRRLAAPLVGAAGFVGFRVPDHPLARELARRAGPITATSANRHGAPPARTPAAARSAFGTSVSVYLPAQPRPSGRPSTLVDLTGDDPRVVPRT
jgi:L-threonylcarbamoyladenylate synthase